MNGDRNDGNLRCDNREDGHDIGIERIDNDDRLFSIFATISYLGALKDAAPSSTELIHYLFDVKIEDAELKSLGRHREM